MTTLQWSVVGSALLLFVVLFFMCDTKAPEQGAIEEKRALEAESTNITVLLQEAKSGMQPAQMNTVLALETQLEQATDDSLRLIALQNLSGGWYRMQQPAIAGYYAEEVAKMRNSEDAWAIAGTTYSLCVQQAKEQKVREYCSQHGITALESASSLNPENAQHKVNLAVLYTDIRPEDNPMKGVLMLIDLNKQYPENTSVLVNLGRLGIQTGQWEKAIGRLEKALAINPNLPEAVCLLADAYKNVGKNSEAAAFKEKCAQLVGQRD